MNQPLCAWFLSGQALPERLTVAQTQAPAFTLPGAQALAAFADLLGADEPPAPQEAKPQRAPFTLPALLPEDMPGEAELSREIDFGALCAGRAALRFALLCGRGEVWIDDPAKPSPRRLAAFGGGPLELDLTQALETRKRLRITLRFDGTRPAGVCCAPVLHTAQDAMLSGIALRPQAARLLHVSADVTALRAGSYALRVQPCPPQAPAPEDMPPARAVSLRLAQGETRRVQLGMSMPGEAFLPGQPYAAPAVKLTLHPEAPSGRAQPPCDEATLMYGYAGAPADAWLPLTPGECRLPPQTLLARLAEARVTSVLLPAPVPDALYAAFTRAGIAVRQMAGEEAQARLCRFPCVTFTAPARLAPPSLEESAWQLCGMTSYSRTPDPALTPAELLAEAAGRPVDDPRTPEVLAWLRAVWVRLRCEAVRQGKQTGALCAPGEWAQPDILQALRTALAPEHLSALPLYGAWWTGTRFSASLRILGGEARPLRGEAALEDAQGHTLARAEIQGSKPGLIEAMLPDEPCVLELTMKLYADEEVIEETSLPVYVGARGPLEAAF